MLAQGGLSQLMLRRLRRQPQVIAQTLAAPARPPCPCHRASATPRGHGIRRPQQARHITRMPEKTVGGTEHGIFTRATPIEVWERIEQLVERLGGKVTLHTQLAQIHHLIAWVHTRVPLLRSPRLPRHLCSTSTRQVNLFRLWRAWFSSTIRGSTRYRCVSFCNSCLTSPSVILRAFNQVEA